MSLSDRMCFRSVTIVSIVAITTFIVDSKTMTMNGDQ